MNEQEARKILGDSVRSTDRLGDGDVGYMHWPSDSSCRLPESVAHPICLDGHFTVEQLEAVVWWLRNKRVR